MPKLFPKPVKSTTVPAKYYGDGTGRDSFVCFGPNQSPPRCRTSMKMPRRNKVVAAVSSPPPRFLPDGSGRDMFMQVNSSHPVIPATGAQIGGGGKLSPMRKAKSANSLLAKPLPSYKSNGQGRDAYVVGRTISSPKSASFIVKPVSKKLCPRTDPPPRYSPTGMFSVDMFFYCLVALIDERPACPPRQTRRLPQPRPLPAPLAERAPLR